MCFIASSGFDGVICVGAVGGTEEDSVCGVVGLRHIQDIWSAWSCSMTDNELFQTKKTDSMLMQQSEELFLSSSTFLQIFLYVCFLANTYMQRFMGCHL